MKKYPVTYKGKKYEVRWEQTMWEDYISIYEVIVGKVFKFKTYECIYSVPEETIDEVLYLSKNDPNYYIEETKKLFEFWERGQKVKKEKELIEANKQKSLEEWDGVVE